MKTFFLCFITFFINGSMFGQELKSNNHENCGFDNLHQKKLISDVVYSSELENFENQVTAFRKQQNKKSKSKLLFPDNIYRVPVVVHVMHLGETIGEGSNISDSTIKQMIQSLNEIYRGIWTAKNRLSPLSVDTEIEFVLTVRDPNGNCSTGIDRVDMSGNNTYVTNGIGTSAGGIADQVFYDASPGWDNGQFLNIWLAHKTSNGGGWALGFQTVFSIGSMYSYVPPHELGHCLNLYHTFQGDDVVTGVLNCPVNNNPLTDGDKCADIPPHKRLTGDCSQSLPNACDGGSADDLYENNYMTYAAPGCWQNRFSQDQKIRMNAKVNGANYYEMNGSLSLVPVSQPNADFYADIKIVCAVGSSVQFFDNSGCVPNNYLSNRSVWNDISFSWTITNGAITYLSDKQNPLITFNQSGVYNVTLTVTNNFGVSTITKNEYLKIDDINLTNCCLATVGFPNYGEPSVSQVQFNTINKITKPTTNQDYQDFRCTNNTAVKEGQTYQLAISYGSTNSNGFFKVFIDYDNDGQFQDSEFIIEGEGLGTYKQKKFTIDVLIPFDAIKNTLLTMRVISNRSAFSETCGNFQNGEIEDYGIMVLSDCATEIIDFESDKTVGCVGSTILFKNKSCFLRNTFFENNQYNWTFTDGTTSFFATGQYPNVTFLNTGDYNVTLNVTTPNGIKTLTKPNFIRILNSPINTCITNSFNVSANYNLNVNKVIFNTINKSTSKTAHEVYRDFRCTDNTILKAGNIYPISITVRSNSSDLERCNAYIDYNNDGLFDENLEKIFSATANNLNVFQTITQDVLIPNNAVKNVFLNMRIIGDRFNINSACARYNNADVEDYSVMIVTDCNSEIIDFESDKTVGCLGNSIAFKDNSCIARTTLLDFNKYNWAFSNGTTTYYSTDVNPSIIFNQLGLYAVTLNIITPEGTRTITKNNFIKIDDNTQNYCAITTTYSGIGQSITNVKLNSINKTTINNNEGYRNFKCTDNTALISGQTHKLFITTKTTYAAEDFKIFIDYNNNAIFENSETVFFGASSSSGNAVFSIDLIIPNIAVKNKMLCMRVIGRTNGNNYNANQITTSCGNFFIGDVEDYGVMITDCAEPPTAKAVQNVCSDNTLSDLSISGNDIKWYDAQSNGNIIPNNTILTDGYTYYASQTIDNCESNNRKSITAVVNNCYQNNSGFGTTTPNSTLEVNGSFARKISKIKTNTTLDINYSVVLCDTNVAINLSLPTAVNIKGRNYIIKNINSGIINILTSKNEKIDTQNTFSLAVNQSITLISDGTNWLIINKN